MFNDTGKVWFGLVDCSHSIYFLELCVYFFSLGVVCFSLDRPNRLFLFLFLTSLLQGNEDHWCWVSSFFFLSSFSSRSFSSVCLFAFLLFVSIDLDLSLEYCMLRIDHHQICLEEMPSFLLCRVRERYSRYSSLLFTVLSLSAPCLYDSSSINDGDCSCVCLVA